MPSTKAFEILSAWLNWTNDDAKFWWYTLGRPLAILLREADYDIHNQYGSLMFLYCQVIEFLGPRPTVSGSPFWRSFMNEDFSPIEYSWTWNTPNEPPKIRFSIEAIGSNAGTKMDLFNQDGTKDLVRRLQSTLPDTDWTLFNHFRDGFCGREIGGSECAEASKQRLGHSSSTFITFEMGNKKVDLKAYFVPIKALKTGKSKLSVLSETIRGLERPDYRLTAYDYLFDFLASHKDGCSLDIVAAAVDCVVPSKSRLKIYVRSSKTSFDSVQATISLGGRIQPFTQKTLQDLQELWKLTLGLEKDFSSASELRENTCQTAGILYNFNVKVGSQQPEPKVYIPVKHYSPNDRSALRGLTTYLNTNGYGRFTEGYKRALESICRHRSLDSESGLQTYLACAVKEGRLVLTSYISPEVYHKARW